MVPYSPPTDSPWNRRASSRIRGAQAPIRAGPGRQAMTIEPKHIIGTEVTMEVLRPLRSAIRPNNQPPTGRMRKPAPNTAAACINCAVGLDFGKNTGAK